MSTLVPESEEGSVRRFRPLEQSDFVSLKHSNSLKGLLRPFKGKGDMSRWANECEGLRGGLIVLAQRVLADATAYPFSLLKVELAQQTTTAGTTFLRWRAADRTSMGVSLWSDLLANPRTPASLLADLYAVEQQRISLNMQISLTHNIARHARDCAQKMAHAEAAYFKRIHPDSIHRQESS